MENETNIKVNLLHLIKIYFYNLYNFKYYRHYFAISSNSGEQFFSFITLSAWLIQQAGVNFERPQEVRFIS